MAKESDDLKQRILDEMTVNYANVLEKNFDLAKKYFKITSQGKVVVLSKDDMSIDNQVLLYLIGKIYAKEAELSETYEVTNNELLEELGINENSLRPRISALREENKITSRKEGNRVFHSIKKNHIEKTLKLF